MSDRKAFEAWWAAHCPTEWLANAKDQGLARIAFEAGRDAALSEVVSDTRASLAIAKGYITLSVEVALNQLAAEPCIAVEREQGGERYRLRLYFAHGRKPPEKWEIIDERQLGELVDGAWRQPGGGS